MALPQPNPALLSNAAPFFGDNTFDKGEEQRSNNAKIFENLEWLDAESHTPKTALVNADRVVVIDSEDGNSYKTITLENMLTILPDPAIIVEEMAVSNWTRFATGTVNAWTNIFYSPDLLLFVVVGASGTGNRVATSPDGIIWTIRTSAADNSWNSVTFGNGLFVAVAGSGTGNRVMTSTNGITWTIRTSAADNNWRAVTYSTPLGLFAAVASSGTGNRVMTSPNGTTWTIRTSAADTSWTDVIFAAGLFVAICGDGGSQRVMTSANGTTWTLRSATVSGVAITFGNGIFVIVGGNGEVATSPDGITWTNQTSGNNIFWADVTFGGKLFVAVSGNAVLTDVMTSPDGINWTLRQAANASIAWSSIAYNNLETAFVAVTASGGANNVMKSLNSGV